jgi:fructoselysine 6-kinase
MVHLLGLGDNTVDTDVGAALQFPGGNAVNVAVMARRAGAKASYLGCVGDDAAGALVRDALIDEGVDISRLRVRKGPNARALIAYENGDRRFLGSRPGVRGTYLLEDADFEFIARHDLTHTSIYSDLEAALPRIRAAAPMLSFDFSERWTSDLLAGTLPRLDVVFLSAPGREDAACVALLQSCLRAGARLAVVTRGAQGAMAANPAGVHRQPAIPAEVVDTLGAGDGFIAAFLMAHLRGADLAEATQAGAAMAAQVCTWRGAFGHAAPWEGERDGIVLRQQDSTITPAHDAAAQR